MAFAFTCTKCGKCCKGGGPALSIDEVFKYQDVFIAGLRWTAYSVSDRHFVPLPDGAYAPSEDLRDHFSSLCGSVKRRGDGDTYYPFIYPCVTGYDQAPGHGCTALSDEGTCSLHADKPLMCKSVPFDPMLPESQQSSVLNQFKDFECMVETENVTVENLLFNEGRIANGEYKGHYDARLNAMKHDMPALIPLIYLLGDGDEPGSFGLPSLTYFLECTSRGGWVETSMMPLLLLLATKLKQVTAQRALEYSAAQSRLITSAIDVALRKRSKADRDRTETMRRYLVQYRGLDDTLSEQKVG